MSAIRYSRKINGKTALLVTAPGDPSGRSNGKLYVFLVEDEEGCPMTLYHTYDINEKRFQYSCLTELADGRIGLLWEGAGVDNNAVNFEIFDIKQILPEETLITIEKGDCNADGKITVADAVLLQKWLLGSKEIRFADWRAADLYEDDRLDAFDLTALRERLVSGSAQAELASD